MTTKRASVESTADAYLSLAARGVEYFFANSGTDFAPLIDAYARRLALGLPAPRPMTIPHEVPAVGMAHGYALVTGRPQVVMVHVIVGAGNAVGGIINAVTLERADPVQRGPQPAHRVGHARQPQSADPLGAGVLRPGRDDPRVRSDYELRNFPARDGRRSRAGDLSGRASGPVYLTCRARSSPRSTRSSSTRRRAARRSPAPSRPRRKRSPRPRGS